MKGERVSLILTKTYELILSRSQDHCRWVVFSRGDSPESEPCSNKAVVTVKIHTTAVSGKTVTHYVGFCSEHAIPTKYRRWFSIGWLRTPDIIKMVKGEKLPWEKGYIQTDEEATQSAD